MEKLAQVVKESKTRIITALMMILVLSFIVMIDSEFLTWATLGVVYLIAFYECCKLFELDEKRLYNIAILIWIVCYVFPQPVLFTILCIVILTTIMLQKENFRFRILLPFLYPTIPLVILFTQYQFFGMFSIVWLVFITASCDAGAYFIGKSIGKTKFSSISPNKTKEGVYGGLAVGVVIGTAFGVEEFSFWTSFAISLAVGLAGIYGDLFESFIKRRAKVKDSGHIFPGHGGMLDRIDSYLFATIVMLTLLEGIVN